MPEEIAMLKLSIYDDFWWYKTENMLDVFHIW